MYNYSRYYTCTASLKLLISVKPIKELCVSYLISIGCKQNEYWIDTRYPSALSFSIYKLYPHPQQCCTVSLKGVTVFTISWAIFFSLSQRKKMGITLMSFNSFSQAMGKYNKCFRRRHQWLSHLGILGECSGFRGSSPIVLTSPFNKPN